MKLEAAALGLPAIIVAAADDQLASGPAFAATGACRYLGDGRSVDPAIVAATLAELLVDAEARDRMTAAGRATVDGHGADRLAAEVLGIAARGRVTPGAAIATTPPRYAGRPPGEPDPPGDPHA
jgi:UDP-N-acetylglucosamine:LPS N-acetylglucosamine transferase